MVENREFNEALEKNAELRREKDKEQLKEATAGTRIESETAGTLDDAYETLEELVDRNEKLVKKRDRLRVSFWVIFGLTVFIAIARYVAWTYGF